MQRQNRSIPRLFRRKSPVLVRGWRWKIIDGPALPFNWTLPVAEAARTMAMEAAYVLSGSRRLPLCLHGGSTHGKDRRKTGREKMPKEHLHAFWLPEDEDADGHIDHILVHAHGGLNPAAVRILAACEKLQLAGSGTWIVRLEWAGGHGRGSLYGPARHWLSRSPVFASRQAHGKIGSRLRQELKQRGFPLPEQMEPAGNEVILGGRQLHVNDFHTVRSNGEQAADTPPGSFWALTFSEPVTGPLSLGFGAHFGLGQFAPVG